MTSRAKIVSALLLTCGLPLLQASAQQQARATVEVGVGVGSMTTSTVHTGSPTGIAFDMLVARQAAGLRSGRLLALGVTVQGAGAKPLVCRDDGRGGCVPGYPDVAAVAALLGWQSANARLRMLAGPSLAYLDNVAIGTHLRADAALPMTSRLAFVSYIRMQNYAVTSAAPYHLFGGGIGVRFTGANRTRSPQSR